LSSATVTVRPNNSAGTLIVHHGTAGPPRVTNAAAISTASNNRPNPTVDAANLNVLRGTVTHDVWQYHDHRYPGFPACMRTDAFDDLNKIDLSGARRSFDRSGR